MKRVDIVNEFGVVTNSWTTDQMPENYSEPGFPTPHDRVVTELDDDPEYIQFTFERDRRSAYEAAGVSIESMVIALWEKVVEGRDELEQDLQAKRLAVKAEIPKPDLT